ncbi:MAG: DUF4012 domain-containing protein [Candidatus Spechtbacterales bacterium]
MSGSENSDKNKKNTSPPAEERAYWRRHLDSSVVDLRNISASVKEDKPISLEEPELEHSSEDVPGDSGRLMKDIGTYQDAGKRDFPKSDFFKKSNENDDGASDSHIAKDSFSDRYSGHQDMPVAYLAKEEYVNQYIEELKRYTPEAERKEMDDERIKKELFQQLTSIDSQDLKIQEQFPKVSPVPKASLVQNEEETEEVESVEEVNNSNASFQLIPREKLKTKPETEDSESDIAQKSPSFAQRLNEYDTTQKEDNRDEVLDDQDSKDKNDASFGLGDNSIEGVQGSDLDKKDKGSKFSIRRNKNKLKRKDRKQILKEPSSRWSDEEKEARAEEDPASEHATKISSQIGKDAVLFGEALARFAQNNEIEIEERIPSRYKKEEITHVPEKSEDVDNSADTKKKIENDGPEEEKPMVLDFSHAHEQEEESSEPEKDTEPAAIDVPDTPKKNKKRKKIALLAIAVCFVIMPSIVFGKLVSLKNESQVNAERAYAHMKEGQEALFLFDAEKSEQSFLQAMDEFSELEKSFSIAGMDTLSLAAKFPIQTSANSNARLVYAGKLISEAGYEASVMLGEFQDLSRPRLAKADADPLQDGEDAKEFTNTLLTAGLRLKNINELLVRANKNLSYVRPEDVPAQFRDELLAAQGYAHSIENYFNEALSHLDVALSFLGHHEPKNYMLIFQNSSELRPTGGFIGTYGLLRINKGNKEELFIDGIYNPDGQLTDNNILIVPPRPLQYATPNWGVRDANWFLDFPTSAEKIIDIYKKTGGPPSGETDNFEGGDFETHGVIALNINMLTRLLELTGPIDMPEYGVELNSENWLPLVQQEVEEDYDRELNRPKQILADLAPMLIEKLTENDNKLGLLEFIFRGLEQKDILVYSRDSEVQEIVLNENWGGELPEPSSSDNAVEDYLAVAISNIGGWKTDLYTDTEVDTTTEFKEDGEIIRRVMIARRHNGGNTPYTWYNEPNRGYIKFYVPPGSELISADGFSEDPEYAQIDHDAEGYIKDPVAEKINFTLSKGEGDMDVFEESGYSVFGAWMLVQPQDRQLASITYKLPEKIDQQHDQYGLYLQKQSGLETIYSGSVEDSHPNLNMHSCSLSDESLEDRQFAFTQTKDEAIVCRISF